MVKRYKPNVRLPTSEKEWLAARLQGIGASEASAVIGRNPYMKNLDLWRIKTGRKAAEDISNKDCVRYGHAAERPVRELFALDYADSYDVYYSGAFDMVRSADNPFLFATLDGRLIEKNTGRKGVLEIKTTDILSSMQKEKWSFVLDYNDINRSIFKIPDNYYLQVLHQLIVTGFDFAVLFAKKKRVYNTEKGKPPIVTSEFHPYFIERSSVQTDIDYLLEQEIKFWTQYVLPDREPPLILPDL